MPKHAIKTEGYMVSRTPFLALITLLLGIGSAQAQDAQIDPNGAVAAPDTVETEIIVEPILPDFSAAELQELVGPIALYPDSLVAIILPASAYPLQIVQAARFLDNLEQDNTLQPDESWDESVIALLNYPEVIRLMDTNIDWTWQLGEAVIAQETDVLNAIADFRTLAYDAGNLETDEIQVVERENEVIKIIQVDEKVVYVPYYEPREVIIYQTRPVYYYYPRRYPVYYYPYDYGYSFSSGYFWGVTTAFSVGWHDHHIHVYHPSYYRHPYYGRYYDTRYHYRRPSINVFNNYYVDNSRRLVRNRARDGSYWRPQRNYGSRPGYDRERRIARTYGGGRDFSNSVRNIRRVDGSGGRQSLANSLSDNRRRTAASGSEIRGARSNANAPSRARGNSAAAGNGNRRASISTTSNRATRTTRESSTALTNRSARALRQSNPAASSRTSSQPRNNARLNTERRSSSALRSSQETRRAISNTPRVRSGSSSNVRAAPSRNRSSQTGQPSARRSAPAPERRAAPSRSSRQSVGGSSSRSRAASSSRSTRSAAPSRAAPSRSARSEPSRGSSSRRRPRN